MGVIEKKKPQKPLTAKRTVICTIPAALGSTEFGRGLCPIFSPGVTQAEHVRIPEVNSFCTWKDRSCCFWKQAGLFFILPNFAALQCSSVCAQSWVPVSSHSEDLSFKQPAMGSLPISLCACAAPGTRDLQCSQHSSCADNSYTSCSDLCCCHTPRAECSWKLSWAWLG